MKILLASQSKYRRELLDRLKINYTHASPTVDEEQLKKTPGISLLDLPLFLAQKKAESLIPTNPDGLTIGCDQMAFLDGKKLDKPGHKEKAVKQLISLQGCTHSLITAVAIHKEGQWIKHVDTTLLTMKPLDESQIRHYVDLENPIDCAGSYKIESLGIVLFSSIKTEDFTAITGLPLLALSRIFNELKIKIL